MAGSGRRKPTATTRLREWVRDQVHDGLRERADVHALSNRAVEWLQADPQLLDDFVYERVYDTVAEIIRVVLLETRRTKRAAERAGLSDDERAVEVRKWLDRMEHLPVVGYVRLGSMRRDDLLAAAEESLARARRETTRARWLRVLAEGLAGSDGETVEEHFTAEQVARAYERAEEVVLARVDAILEGTRDAYDRLMRGE